MKNFICFILVILSLYGCASTKPPIIEYKTVTVPEVFKTIPNIPEPPTVEEFTKLQQDNVTMDYKRQRDLLKDYSIELLGHVNGLRDKYFAILKYIEDANKEISKKD